MWPIYANHHCGWMQIWFVRNLSFHHATLQPATKTGEKEGEIWGRCNDTRVQQMFSSLLTNFPAHRPKPTETSLLRLSWRQILGALVSLRWARCEGVFAFQDWHQVPTTGEKLGAVRGVEPGGGVEGRSGRVPSYSPRWIAPWGSQLVDARALPGEGSVPSMCNLSTWHSSDPFAFVLQPSSSQRASSLPVYLNGEILGLLCPGIEFVFRRLFKARQ